MSAAGYLAPEHIRRIVPYSTGLPADLLRRQLGVERVVQLATNENTTGPAPQVVEAMRRAAAGAHHYPDGGGHHLRERIALRMDVDRGQVVLGNGSAEVVEILCRTFLEAGDRVVVSSLGFIQYRLSAQVANATVVAVPPPEGGRKDDPLALAAAARGARIVFLANPNNPTGTFLTRADLDAYFRAVDGDVLTVVDQAYQEYVEDPEYPDALDDLRAGRNVLVLRTFSKAHGLAGLRIGYGVGPAPVLDQVERARLPYNTNAIAQAAALTALDQDAHLRAIRRRNAEERAFLTRELRRRGHAVTPSAGNFLLVDPPRPAEEVISGLRRQGVLVCPTAAYDLAGSLRVTVGTRGENEQLLAALDGLAP